MKRLLLAFAFCTVALAGCARHGAGTPQTVSMQIGQETFSLEVADTDALREKGLMNRDSLPANQGMIFVFPYRFFPGFWMHNTRIPLDILFIDQDGTVVTIRTMKPMDESTVRPTAPVKYAVELNAGAATRCGVREGDKLQLPALPTP